MAFRTHSDVVDYLQPGFINSIITPSEVNMIIYLVQCYRDPIPMIHAPHSHIKLKVPRGMTAGQLVSAIGNNWNPLEALSAQFATARSEPCPCQDNCLHDGVVDSRRPLRHSDLFRVYSISPSKEELAEVGIKEI